ncbi:hypothetical protein [Okeania sp. KiyG1]|uniref:hypothetical protein n=1 Tax=Okeania sp. KiyG1 TaxID=2720165 RepID=UPI001921C3DB|nr:hypothetical protein [Okeania sp. KiyG1]
MTIDHHYNAPLPLFLGYRLRAKENNIQYQVQIISDRTVSFVLLRHLLADHFVCVAFQRKEKSGIHNPIIPIPKDRFVGFPLSTQPTN